ncbi:MAG: arylamine N-acetyltransferase [Cyclobacteriaceae bacterium]|nr:arylamine N-acetyltransferase [Cyclobacteriaceae bacterium]
MDKKEYLNRICFTDEVLPTLEVLQKLQLNHLLHIPFENLDIHYQKPIQLNIAEISKKILGSQRGGFCYELNGLFFELLTSIGFRVKRVSAKVYDKDNGYGQEYDHLALIVNLNETEYLVDVGFGDFAFSPIPIKLGELHLDVQASFLIESVEDDYLKVSKVDNGSERREYLFKNVPRSFSEFESMCYYQQTSPKSHFTQQKLITKPTKEGRITLTSDKLKITILGKTEERVLKSEEEFNDVLTTHFQINMDRL